jgi:uncharacterized phage-associated protein
MTDTIEKNELNLPKFKQVLHYIIHNCGCAPNVGKTVLWKILYFSDFDYYEIFEEFLTGETYYKLAHGPAPGDFDTAIAELTSEGKVESVDSRFGKYDQKRFLSCNKPDVSLLSATELQHIESTISKYSHMNATQVSAISHADLPYIATEDNFPIKYELVFYRDPQMSVREYQDD